MPLIQHLLSTKHLFSITCNYSYNPSDTVIIIYILEMGNGGSERGGELLMVTQTVSDRAGIGTQVIWIPEPMFFLDCPLWLPSSSSVFHSAMAH